jgi:hypothetical protein
MSCQVDIPRGSRNPQFPVPWKWSERIPADKCLQQQNTHLLLAWQIADRNAG